VHQKSKLWVILGIIAALGLGVYLYFVISDWYMNRPLSEAERAEILKNYEAYSLSSTLTPEEIVERATILKMLQKETPSEPTVE